MRVRERARLLCHSVHEIHLALINETEGKGGGSHPERLPVYERRHEEGRESSGGQGSGLSSQTISAKRHCADSEGALWEFKDKRGAVASFFPGLRCSRMLLMPPT